MNPHLPWTAPEGKSVYIYILILGITPGKVVNLALK
jgi:hypothetical protein